MATATTTTATLNVVSLHGTGNYTGPACIILNTAGAATLSQVQQQQHQHLLVNPRNDQDYFQSHRLQQQQQQLSQHQQSLDRANHQQNNNNNNFNINNIGTATNNGTVVGVVGVGELVGLVGVGPSVLNVPPCPTTTAATVKPTVLAPLDTTTTSTAALALRLSADPSVTIPAVLRSINAPAPITTNVTSSNVILNVSRVLNNHTTTTTTTTTTNNNNNNNINCKNYNINTNNNLTSDNNNNNGSHVDNNIKKLKMRTTCHNGLLDLHSQHLLPTLQQAYQQNPTQHQPELLRCKRRIDFSGLGFTLPRAQPAAVARRNERERNRVKLVNLGFEALREHVPSGRKNKKMSKVETLRAAVQYIKNLQEMLQHEPDFIDITDLEACAAVASAAAAHLTSSACGVAQSQMATSVSSTSISPPPNSDISCSPSSSLCSDSGSSCDPFNEDDLIDFSRLL